MFAIFKRELRSYFTSLVGYVVIGVMLAFIGLYYSDAIPPIFLYIIL